MSDINDMATIQEVSSPSEVSRESASEIDAEMDNKYDSYLQDGKTSNYEYRKSDSSDKAESVESETDTKEQDELNYELDNKYNDYVSGNKSFVFDESHSTDKDNHQLPEVFDGMNDADKQKNVEALSKMSDDEKTKYLNIADKEPAITKDAQEIAKNNGSELQGLDHRLKTPDSTYEKMHERGNDIDVGKMQDVIRYTEVYPPDKLAEGANSSLAEYEAKGYSVDRVKNTWTDDYPTYKGINANITTPEGQTFEVQFHTQESFDLKNGELHDLYEERRTMSDDNPKAVDLEDRMKELSAELNEPKNIDEVKNR